MKEEIAGKFGEFEMLLRGLQNLPALQLSEHIRLRT